MTQQRIKGLRRIPFYTMCLSSGTDNALKGTDNALKGTHNALKGTDDAVVRY